MDKFASPSSKKIIRKKKIGTPSPFSDEIPSEEKALKAYSPVKKGSLELKYGLL
jgi:hypothetical protein